MSASSGSTTIDPGVGSAPASRVSIVRWFEALSSQLGAYWRTMARMRGPQERERATDGIRTRDILDHNQVLYP